MKATSLARRFRAALGYPLLGITLAATLAACGTSAAAVPTTPATATPIILTATPVTPTATPVTPTVVTPSPTVALPSPTVTATSTSIPRPSPRCEAFWRIEVNAWIDSDGNGQRDADELPLAGVQFTMGSGSHGVSDEAGQYVFRPITGCGSTPTFTVTATPPEGYALTTPDEVKLAGGSAEGTKVAFGFTAK